MGQHTAAKIPTWSAAAAPLGHTIPISPQPFAQSPRVCDKVLELSEGS